MTKCPADLPLKHIESHRRPATGSGFGVARVRRLAPAFDEIFDAAAVHCRPFDRRRSLEKFSSVCLDCADGSCRLGVRRISVVRSHRSCIVFASESYRLTTLPFASNKNKTELMIRGEWSTLQKRRCGRTHLRHKKDQPLSLC